MPTNPAFIIYIIVSMTILFSLLCMMSVRCRNARNKIIKLKEAYASLQEKHDVLMEELQSSNNNMGGKNETMQIKIHELEQELNVLRNSDEKLSQWNDEATLLFSIEVSSLRKHAVKGSAPDSLWVDLFNVARLYLPSFMDLIQRDKFGLSAEEIKISLLVRLNFTNSEIQNLLNISPQVLTNRKSKINRKIFNEKSARTLNYNIMHIK